MDINTQLSPSFKVRDLIQTTYAIPNVPTDDYLPNLTSLAQLLEHLKTIDDFRIESGFRSPALNAAVHGAENSYHAEGLAADIVPLNLSARDFWLRIHNDPAFYNAVGEYGLKENRNTPNVHVSAPTANKIAFDLIETSPGVYVRSGIPRDGNFVAQTEQQTSVPSEDNSEDYSYEAPAVSPLLIAGVLAAGLLLFAAMQAQRRSV